MQKHVNLVDLVKSFPTNILLQILASIQKRTSPLKFFGRDRSSGSISNLSTTSGEPLRDGLLDRDAESGYLLEVVLARVREALEPIHQEGGKLAQPPVDGRKPNGSNFVLAELEHRVEELFGGNPPVTVVDEVEHVPHQEGVETLVERFDIEPFSDFSAK